MNTLASLPHLPQFGSIMITGSTAARMPNTRRQPVGGPGSAEYG
jgi:hypothetical protein